MEQIGDLSYMFVPVNPDGVTHWSLTAICMPNEENEQDCRSRNATILHLDSYVGPHDSKEVFMATENFMKRVLRINGDNS
ncbi:hypothetical protein BRADI_3g11016v3 [Brachypodium distachyon]|uniref:Ubiquitin-like protease family profile domain-containing protein n=1 Tax=Brachypodium distachyon TaxID=15368 RepID=A0A2K2CWI6_BRADI|nr:hypothetical protein BRADI_3g11016v3 [Brachypodium distachyon]